MSRQQGSHDTADQERTRAPDLGLFANHHTLQDAGISVRREVPRDCPDLVVVKGVFPEHGVEDSEGVADLVDGSVGG